MVWPLVAMAAVNAVMGGIAAKNKAKVENAQINAENKISAARAEGANRVRTFSNGLLAAQNGLQRWAQSANNKAVLDAGAEAYEANTVNALRMEDAVLEGDFETSIRDAEQAGGQAAAAATMGLMGGVVDTINQTTSLRRARAKQSAMYAADQRSFDQRTQAANIMSQTVRGLDGSVIFDNFDFGTDVATKRAEGMSEKYAFWSAAGSSAFNSAMGIMSLGAAKGTAPSPAAEAGYTGGLRVPAQTGTSYQFNLPSSGSGLKIG